MHDIKYELQWITQYDIQQSSLLEVNEFIQLAISTDLDHLLINYPYNHMDLCIGSYLLRLTVNDKLIGFALLYPMARGLIYLRNLYILKQYRGGLVFSQTIDIIKQKFKELGFIKLMTFIDKKAQSLILRCEQVGFIVTAQHTQYSMLELSLD